MRLKYSVCVCVCVGAPVDLLFMYVHMCLRVFIECVCDTNTIWRKCEMESGWAYRDGKAQPKVG